MKVVVRKDGTLAVEQSSVRADGTPSNIAPIYGPGGLFGICGDHPTLFNATVGPMGVESILTWVGSDETDPTYSALVDINSSGYAQSGLCSDCGTPSFSRCTQSACFGRLCQGTNEHAIDQLGLRTNRGVSRKVLFGDITDPAGNVLAPQGSTITDAFTLDLIGAAYNLRRMLGDLIWTGDPANNAGGYMEFPGLVNIINTGKRDVLSGALCDGLDSYVRSYGSNVVGAAGSPSILSYLRGMVRSINYRIQGINKNSADAEQYLVMHPRLWDCVAAAAACEFGLVCNTGSTTNQDAVEVAERLERMLSGMYIRIDGRDYPVVLDNLMPSSIGYLGDDTIFCGDIALLTTTLEGELLLHGEYQDFDMTTREIVNWFQSMFGARPWAVTDGGRFLYAYDVEGGLCVDAKVVTAPRIRAYMPQLLGRITNVCCAPEGFYPDVTGTGGIYELGGGSSSTPVTGLYGDCGTLTVPQ